MKDLNDSIAESLDANDKALTEYLPYILQDLLEFGADPETMINIVKEHIENKNINILDLGCGKGAVSIKMAKEFNCKVMGIDAVPEFIEEANKYAKKYNVENLCQFLTGDIRTQINELKEFDLVILGAIGPVLGNIFETLNKLSSVLKKNGYVLMDDGYIEDDSPVEYSRCLRKTEFYNQIKNADFEIIYEDIFNKNVIEESDDFIFDSIKKRIDELIEKYPEKKELFLGYLRKQEYENDMIENELITGNWLLRKIK